MERKRDYGKRTAVIIVLCAGAMLTGRSASGQKSEAAESLPEGAGRTLILQSCVQCHDFKSIVSQRKTSEGWRRTVDEMIWRGAPLMTDESEVITNYLASAFGPDAPAPKAAANASAEKEENTRWAKELPAGAGRALVIQACAQCHGLKTVVAQRKTAAGWRRSVNEMMRLGAQLTASESETIANYLAASFKPDQPKGGR
jgi:mono/diheme cytochrome c family protein